MLRPRCFEYKKGFKQPHNKNKQPGCFYGKYYFSLNKWNEEKILTSPFSWILKLDEKEYLKKINSVQNKYNLKKIDDRFQILKDTGLFSETVITKFLQDKNKKEKEKISMPKPKLSP